MIVESRTTFVKGHQILSVVLIANEAIKEAKKRNNELILLKTDFKKAYKSMDYKDKLRMKMMSFLV